MDVISPDVAKAVTDLERQGVLAPPQARLFGRIARGELASLANAIRGLLSVGVLALTTGVGLLFKAQIANLGPLSIASLVAAAAVACLVWVHQRAAPFSPEATPSSHLALDSILMLGALLAAGDLAYIERHFTPLGAAWPYHLLVVSLGYAALALRFDSRALFTVALTTFAAWRGVATMSLDRAIAGALGDLGALRLNTLACGLLFLFLGRELIRREVKVHFEPVAAHVGWFLILQSVAWGMGDGFQRLALIAVGGGLAWHAWRYGRFALFVFGVLAAYVAIVVTISVVLDEPFLVMMLTSGSSLFLLFGLIALHRTFPKEGGA